MNNLKKIASFAAMYGIAKNAVDQILKFFMKYWIQFVYLDI